MPRCAREKSYDSMYHIMCKANAGAPLFMDRRDKDRYLYLIRKYQKKHLFKVYAYCLMTTHVHIIVNCNGADISTIMHGINQSYAQYFNTRHHSYGHVFHDRFKSKIINDDRYLINLSAYIHNNPTDIKGYKNCPEKFYYSSLGIYLGFRRDEYEILDVNFIMEMFGKDAASARVRYYKMVISAKNPDLVKEFEFIGEKTEYRSERKVLAREFSPQDIVAFVIEYTGVDPKLFKGKHRRDAIESRALCAFLIRCYCNFNYRDICSIMGGLTLSRIAVLVNKGIELIDNDPKYKNIAEDFLKRTEAA